MIIEDGHSSRTFFLNRSYFGLYVPPMIWAHLENFSSGSVSLVLASAHYDESDYYRDRDAYAPSGARHLTRVPFLAVGEATQELRPEIDEAIDRVLSSGWYLLGRETAAFEAAFADYVGARHCVTVGSGLDALGQLSLRAMKSARATR